MLDLLINSQVIIKVIMRKFLYVAVFFSGMASLAVEMSASRLLGNFFGTSNLVWASIIGLILIYLAIGYFLGGYWVDHSPSFRTFYSILLWASLLIGIVPIVSRPVLRFAADAFDQLQLGILFGSFTAVMILLGAPVTLLGTASPFAIRLAIHENKQIGSITGKIYAISTLGSFIGTFVPSLVLIPLIGTYRTFLTCGAILLLISLIGLWLSSGWRVAASYIWIAIIFLILLIWGLPGNDKNTSGQIFETESAYNYIQVLEVGEYRLLRLNEGQGIHSIYHPVELNYHGPWEQVLVAPYFNISPINPDEVKSMAIIGLAAGTTARQASAVYKNIKIDGFEIDPKIIDVGKVYFDMNNSNLNIFIQDGRWGLSHSNRKYQIISIDAYRPPYIPSHLTTKEFFFSVHEHLTDDGVMVINVGHGPSDRRLINILASTIQTAFPSIHVMDIPDSFNSILFASVQPTDLANLIENYKYLSQKNDVHPLLIDTIYQTLTNIQSPPQPGEIFTDDLAPIEWVTNTMVLDFVFSNDMEQ